MDWVVLHQLNIETKLKIIDFVIFNFYWQFCFYLIRMLVVILHWNIVLCEYSFVCCGFFLATNLVTLVGRFLIILLKVYHLIFFLSHLFMLSLLLHKLFVLYLFKSYILKSCIKIKFCVFSCLLHFKMNSHQSVCVSFILFSRV
jgi:hypothetical protein